MPSSHAPPLLKPTHPLSSKGFYHEATGAFFRPPSKPLPAMGSSPTTLNYINRMQATISSALALTNPKSSNYTPTPLSMSSAIAPSTPRPVTVILAPAHHSQSSSGPREAVDNSPISSIILKPFSDPYPRDPTLRDLK